MAPLDCHYSLLRQRIRAFTTRWFTSQPSSPTSCSRSSSFAGSRCTGPPRASHTCSHPRWTNCCCPQFGLTLQIRFHIMKEAPRWCKPDKRFPNWKSSRPNLTTHPPRSFTPSASLSAPSSASAATTTRRRTASRTWSSSPPATPSPPSTPARSFSPSLASRQFTCLRSAWPSKYSYAIGR